jgi:hypothetical protein
MAVVSGARRARKVRTGQPLCRDPRAHVGSDLGSDVGSDVGSGCGAGKLRQRRLDRRAWEPAAHGFGDGRGVAAPIR